MRRRRSIEACIVVAFLALYGCDDGDGETDAGVDAGSAPVDAGPPPEGMVLRGLVRDFLTNAALDGVEICVLDTTTCTTSGADGTYTLYGIPEAMNVAVIFTQIRHLPTIFPIHLTSDGIINSLLLSDSAVRGFESQLSTTFDETRGHLAIGAFEGTMGIPGVTVSADPMVGSAVYMSEVFALDASLTGTTTAGRAGFINADVVAEVDLTFTIPAGFTCERAPYSWTGTGHTYRLPMRAGAVSSVPILPCTPAP